MVKQILMVVGLVVLSGSVCYAQTTQQVNKTTRAAKPNESCTTFAGHCTSWCSKNKSGVTEL